jgi:predicted RNA-binding Zn-ribbon protein involved in translation (DUF1610 family)
MIRHTFLLLLFVPLSLQAQTRPDPVTIRFERELSALSPANPLSYYLLAEEISDVAIDKGEMNLARRLFVLSIELSEISPEADRNAGFPLASSASVALADIETIQPRKRWLLALAGRLDERYSAKRWDVQEDEPETDEVALLLTEAIGLVLSGDGSLARERFDDPRVLGLLESTRDAIDRPGTDASTSAIQREAKIWPCPECGNSRIVADRSQGGSARRLCSTCRGNPGPVIDHDTFEAYIAYQSLLLAGVHKSWSAELAVGLSGPLLDPDVSEIAPMMRIDPELVYYRNGTWVSREDVLENAPSG